MTNHDKQIVRDLIAIGVVGTIVSIPLGLWAIPRFHDSPWKAVALLTAAGYVTKSLMMSHGGES